MTKIFSIGLIIILTSILSFSCKKQVEVQTPNDITYPFTTNNYPNILSGTDTVYIQSEYLTAFSANLQDQASLLITLTNLTDSVDSILPSWTTLENTSWIINPMEETSKKQIFAATPGSLNKLFLRFDGDYGVFKIEYQENDSEIRNKIGIWEK